MNNDCRHAPEAHPALSAATVSPPLAPAVPDPDDVFEGPEKKLEVFFSLPPSAGGGAGLRAAPEAAWSDILSAASCSILHRQANDHFDAYLLSESSLFVYPYKAVLKTCGSTTLILVLPKLLALADGIGAALEHVHYSHYEYKFPHLQPYPHTSYAEEQATLASLLGDRVAGVTARVLGEEGSASGPCWYALCTEAHPAPPVPPPAVAAPSAAPPPLSSGASDAVLEVAMEGLSDDVCAIYHGTNAAHEGKQGKALAHSMSRLGGVAGLVGGADVDDWAFEPCGYSMNAQKGPHYYTVHITPETAFSYASFETTDPELVNERAVAAIVAAFQPTRLTVTLTTRTPLAGAPPPPSPLLPALALDGFVAAVHDHAPLSNQVAVTCRTYVRQPSPADAIDAIDPTAIAAALGGRTLASSALSLADSEEHSASEERSISEEADSESTAPLESETGSSDEASVHETKQPPTKRVKACAAADGAGVGEGPPAAVEQA